MNLLVLVLHLIVLGYIELSLLILLYLHLVLLRQLSYLLRILLHLILLLMLKLILFFSFLIKSSYKFVFIFLRFIFTVILKPTIFCKKIGRASCRERI